MEIKRTKIVDIFNPALIGTEVCVKGWVRTRRGNKQVQFIALNDGSTIKNVQIVIDPAKVDENLLKDITTGACIGATGKLVESQGAGQSVEIQGENIVLYGTCPNDYPMQKKGQTFEYMRKYAHMRLRTNTFGAVFRIRHNMAMAVHNYFNQHGFFYFHSPIITASDCEGAGEMFQVTTKNLYKLDKDESGSIKYDDDFFGKMTSLTVSGQLEGELGATALGAIYTFGPTFRAENSNTPRHLAEFWMIEPEVAFLQLNGLMDLEEDFIKYCVKWALDNCKDDLEFLNKMIDAGVRVFKIEGRARGPEYVRTVVECYNEAINAIIAQLQDVSKVEINSSNKDWGRQLNISYMPGTEGANVDEATAKGWYVTANIASSVQDLNTDYAVVAKEYFTVSGAALGANVPESGIYIVKTVYSNGTVKFTKEQVVK